MEFGQPPLYAEANRVARDFDLNYIKELGPFLRCLFLVTNQTVFHFKKEDQILQGSVIGGAKENVAGAFLLWRGATMKKEWI